MDEVTGEEEVAPHLIVWKERFEKLEKIIIRRLSQERKVAIAENVLRLLKRLFEQLNGYLREQWDEYKHREAAIKHEVIPNLAEFTSFEQLRCQQMLEDAISSTTKKVDLLISQHRDLIMTRIRNAIFEASDETALQNVVKSGAEAILKDLQQVLHKKLQGQIENISNTGRRAGNEFDRKFTEAYNRLQALAGKVEIQTTLDNKVSFDTSDILASMQALQNDIDAKDGYFLLGGAAAGAAIGTAILPVIGTVVGGFIGFVASTGFFTSLDKRKQQLWDQLRPSLENYFHEVEGQTKQTVQTYGRNVNNALNQRIEKYVMHYEEIVNKILSEQKSELQRLNNLQTTISTDLQELERRSKSLEAQQARLVSINA